MSQWFVPIKTVEQASKRLFCFPFAGGGTAAYRRWMDKLPAEVDCYTLLLPGRERRFGEKPLSDLTTLIENLVAEIAPLLDRPFYFYGHSMGSLIAFELARQLRRTGLELPQKLIFSGRRAAALKDPHPPVFNLPKEEFIAALRTYNGTPTQVLDCKELLDIFLPALRGDLTMNGLYRYQEEAPLSCPITVFGGLEDRIATEVELSSWSEETTADFQLTMLSGDHFFIHKNQETFLPLLCQAIQ
ncbi:MAG: putative thioesterase [SAR324 cluster bacterium]|uniref:Putative thioesterase n=1 Tax=SAR324 cluster bacterium TaxID=2024889 RepID=A0A2A4T0N4_9DELT|nr:MAG: putative thioesterase [SAR324 cluster bacterium]